ncbi:hypothetical protein ABZP36_013091 [Zizania latifolia]
MLSPTRRRFIWFFSYVGLPPVSPQPSSAGGQDARLLPRWGAGLAAAVACEQPGAHRPPPPASGRRPSAHAAGPTAPALPTRPRQATPCAAHAPPQCRLAGPSFLRRWA